VPINGVPSARFGHTAIWTGSEMIIWGGYNGFRLADGGRYNPALNTWTAIPPEFVPNGGSLRINARMRHTAVWTGTEMIIWGGQYLRDDWRYNPVVPSWTRVSTNGAPTPRELHIAVWTKPSLCVFAFIRG